MVIPRRVLITCVSLGATRALLFLGVWVHNSELDAQWQLAYLPFLAIDFPISYFYQAFPVPIPEAVVGPIWWCAMPFGIWWVIWGRRRSYRVK